MYVHVFIYNHSIVISEKSKINYYKRSLNIEWLFLLKFWLRFLKNIISYINWKVVYTNIPFSCISFIPIFKNFIFFYMFRPCMGTSSRIFPDVVGWSSGSDIWENSWRCPHAGTKHVEEDKILKNWNKRYTREWHISITIFQLIYKIIFFNNNVAKTSVNNK